MLFAQADEPLHPAEERERRPLLRFDVDGVEAIDRVGDEWSVEPRRIGARESAVAIPGPLHRRADAVAVAEIDVVAHADLVAVVDDRRARQREEQAVHQLDTAPAVLHQRRQPPSDAAVDPHLRIAGVGLVHVVALFVGDHLERQLVVVAKEEAPLARIGEVRGLAQDLDDRMPIFLPHRHEHSRHQREVERHVAFVAVTEVRPHFRRPLVCLREEQPILVPRVHRGANALEDVVRLVEVGARRPLALDKVGNGIEAHAVDAAIEPEVHDSHDGVEHRRVVEVQIRLVMKEAVPVVGACRFVPCPVRLLGVREDDRYALILLVGVAPDVELARRRSRGRLPRRLEPWMLVGRVIDDELGDDPDLAPLRFLDEAVEVLQRSVGGVNVLVVGDVVAVVLERRRIEGQQPERIDAEPLEIRELAGQARKIADTVGRTVDKGPHMRLVDDRVLVPQ